MMTDTPGHRYPIPSFPLPPPPPFPLYPPFLYDPHPLPPLLLDVPTTYLPYPKTTSWQYISADVYIPIPVLVPMREWITLRYILRTRWRTRILIGGWDLQHDAVECTHWLFINQSVINFTSQLKFTIVSASQLKFMVVFASTGTNNYVCWPIEIH